jgi:predicted secreted acid phosphatase
VEVDDGLVLVEAPYIKEPCKKKYTLVLDLDETLLHYFEVGKYQRVINLL